MYAVDVGQTAGVAAVVGFGQVLEGEIVGRVEAGFVSLDYHQSILHMFVNALSKTWANAREHTDFIFNTNERGPAHKCGQYTVVVLCCICNERQTNVNQSDKNPTQYYCRLENQVDT